MLPLDNAGTYGVKLTTARFYTPSGKAIQTKGIVPDILVENIDVKTAKNKKENEEWFRKKIFQVI